MAIFVPYNCNPQGRRIRDCVYRALSRFLCISWREAVDDLVSWAADRGLTNFNYSSTYTPYLKEKGYIRHKAPRKGITVREFCEQYAEKGKLYILSCPRHLTIAEWAPDAHKTYSSCVVVDSWDCRSETVNGYWEREWAETQNGPVTRDGCYFGYDEQKTQK